MIFCHHPSLLAFLPSLLLWLSFVLGPVLVGSSGRRVWFCLVLVLWRPESPHSAFSRMLSLHQRSFQSYAIPCLHCGSSFPSTLQWKSRVVDWNKDLEMILPVQHWAHSSEGPVAFWFEATQPLGLLLNCLELDLLQDLDRLFIQVVGYQIVFWDLFGAV